MEKQNILIIDDQVENLDILYNLLSDNYDISATTTSKNLIKIFNHRIPDLILLDVIMPEIDGYEIFRELKLIDPLIDVPVIFLTSKDDPVSEEKGLKLGAVDYITKPYNPAILKARVKTQLLLKERTIQLQKLLNKKDTELLKNRVNNLLNNIDQGILSFGFDLKVESGYSKRTLDFFKKDPSGKPIDELFFKAQEHEKKVFNKAMNMIKGNREPSYIEMCLSILPKEAMLNERSVKLDYKALPNEKFMITIEDITDTKELEKTINDQQQVQKMIVAIAANKDEFLELKTDFEDFVTNIKDSLKSEDDYVIFLRQLHTYKGLFAQKEMNYVVESIHNLETNLKHIDNCSLEMRKKILTQVNEAHLLTSFNNDIESAASVLGKEYFETIGKSYRLNTLKNIEKKIKLILEQNIVIDSKILRNILNDILTLDLIPLYTQFISYPSLVLKTAETLGKKIYPVKIEGERNVLVPSKYKNFTKTLIHVYRNCVDHGVEDPDTRTIFYKDEYGTIKTKFYEKENNLVIEISDDGAGINVGKVLQKALDHNIFTKEQIEELDEQEKLMLIFHDKLSTKDRVSHVSGRGIGLSAVKEEVEKLNGTIEIENTPVFGSLFRFILPLKNSYVDQKEMDVIIEQSILYFKDSLFLDIKSIETMEEYISSDQLTVISFTGDLHALCSIEIDKELTEYLTSVMLPENFPLDEKILMVPEIQKEILNTFIGLSINDLKQLNYNKLGITIPSIINKDSYDKIVQNSAMKSFIKIGTNKGSYICSFIKNI